jgi:hypothetical protein
VDFGHLALGQKVIALVPLSNVGPGTLQITNQAIVGAGFFETTPLVSTTLPAGDATRAFVAFAPTVTGGATGTLTFTGTGDPATVTIELLGVGLDLAVSATPPSLSFGNVAVGASPTPAQTVSLENPTASSIFVTLGTSGTAPQYTVIGPSGDPVNSTPIELLPSTPYALTVSIAPDAAAVFDSFFTATPCLDQTTANCVAAQTIRLSGVGTSGQLMLAPDPIVLDADGGQVVTVSNVGTATATVTCLSLESLGSAACGRSSAGIALGTPSAPIPATLTAGGSLTIPLTARSTDGGPGAGDILVASYLPEGLPISAMVTAQILLSQ